MVGKRSNIYTVLGVNSSVEGRCQDWSLYSGKLEKGTGCVCLLMRSAAALCLQLFLRLLRKTRARLYALLTGDHFNDRRR